MSRLMGIYPCSHTIPHPSHQGSLPVSFVYNWRFVVTIVRNVSYMSVPTAPFVTTDCISV